jgi:glucokinase
MPLYAGFDLGGTHLKYGVIDRRGKVLFKAKVATPTELEDLINLLEAIWGKLKTKHKEPISACGFGFPGIFHYQEKKIYQSPHFPELDHFDLFLALSRFMDVPFWMNNDANMAAFAEYKMGAGRGVQSLILLTIGTGIGTGIILEGRLWQGLCGFAGELGHATVNPEGEKCCCGSHGCLETEVSAPKIAKIYKDLKNKEGEIEAEEVFQRAREGEEEARRAYAQAGYYLGIGLSLAINLLNPEKILLGGGVMEAAEFILPPAREEARKRSFCASFECCSIEKAALGNDAGFIGAALWAKDQSINM